MRFKEFILEDGSLIDKSLKKLSLEKLIDISIKAGLVNKKLTKSGGNLLVDSDGNPRKFYHGSRKKFKDIGISNIIESGKEVYYFTEDVEYAKEYGDKLSLVFLVAKKLMDTKTNKEQSKELLKYIEEENKGIGLRATEIELEHYGLPSWTNKVAYKFAIDNGYDCIRLNERNTPSHGYEAESYAIFNLDNIIIPKKIELIKAFIRIYNSGTNDTIKSEIDSLMK